MLPDFPRRTIAVLSTVDPAPHAIPVSAPVRADDTTILLNLHRSRDSLARLRENPAVALTVLAEGDVAFTARGRARVIQDELASDPAYAGVAIAVEHVDDHRQPAFAVDSGVGRAWRDDAEKRRLGARVEELTCAPAR
jgi:nitroimidazol reductase NimA-like FMN-containing flavoprotein (pyridoxamine 5'-phosphate oxidase superfamily)